MEQDIVIVNDSYEIHPTIQGGYAVVAVASGEVVQSCLTLDAAKDAAKYYIAERD